MKSTDYQQQVTDTVKASTSANRAYFISYIFFTIYVLLIIASTTDYQLLSPGSTVRLPFLDLSISLEMFYFVSPIFILAIHFNLLQNLEAHHFKLLKWRELQQNNISRILISPFLYDFSVLDSKSQFSKYVRIFSNILFVYLSPFTLLIFLVYFSKYQSFIFTLSHLSILIIDFHFINVFYKSINKKIKFGWILILLAFTQTFLLFYVLYGENVELWSKADNRSYFDGTEFRLETYTELEDSSYTRKKEPLWSYFLPRLVIKPTNIAALSESSNLKNFDKPRIDLSNRNLKGAQLIGFDFNNVLLINTNLEGANLSYTTFKNADFGNTNLYGASFEQANLNGLNLSSSNLNNANFNNTNLENANLSNAKLNFAYFGDAKLKNTNFNAVKAFKSNFQFSEINGANLYGGKFQSSNFVGVKIENSDLREAEFQGSHFEKAKIISVNMGKGQFQGTNFNDAQIISSSLVDAQFQASEFNNTNFLASDFTNASMQGVNLSGARFNGSILRQTKMRGSINSEISEPPILVQVNEIDFKTTPDWAHIRRMNESEDYLKSIQNAESASLNYKQPSKPWFVYSDKSLSDNLPEICTHGYLSLLHSLNFSLNESIDFQTISFNPSQSSINALKEVTSIKSCSDFSSQIKDNYKSDFYSSISQYLQ